MGLGLSALWMGRPDRPASLAQATKAPSPHKGAHGGLSGWSTNAPGCGLSTPPAEVGAQPDLCRCCRDSSMGSCVRGAADCPWLPPAENHPPTPQPLLRTAIRQPTTGQLGVHRAEPFAGSGATGLADLCSRGSIRPSVDVPETPPFPTALPWLLPCCSGFA